MKERKVVIVRLFKELTEKLKGEISWWHDRDLSYQFGWRTHWRVEKKQLLLDRAMQRINRLDLLGLDSDFAYMGYTHRRAERAVAAHK